MIKRYCSFLAVLFALAACAVPTQTPTPTPAAPFMIYADAAAANVLRDIRTAFLQEHPGAEIQLVLDEPSNLGTPPAAGPQADLVLTADAELLTDLQKQNRLAAPPRVVASDPLVVFVSRENPKQVDRIEDLNRGGLEFAIAQEDTTLGERTRALIDNFRTDASFGPDFPQLLLAGVRDESKTGEEILNRVLQNEADVGIVFASQANVQRNRIRALEITRGLNVLNDYSVALFAASADSKRAQEFLDFLFAPQAQTLWHDYGFETKQ